MDSKKQSGGGYSFGRMPEIEGTFAEIAGKKPTKKSAVRKILPWLSVSALTAALLIIGSQLVKVNAQAQPAQDISENTLDLSR